MKAENNAGVDVEIQVLKMSLLITKYIYFR